MSDHQFLFSTDNGTHWEQTHWFWLVFMVGLIPATPLLLMGPHDQVTIVVPWGQFVIRRVN